MDDFTQLEKNVLQLLATTGWTNKQIAEYMCYSVKYINNVITSIYKKLEVANRVEAVITARQLMGLDR